MISKQVLASVYIEDVKIYDEAKKSNESSIPIDVAFKMIEDKRKAR